LAHEESVNWLRNWLPSGPWTVIADNEGGRRSRWEVQQFLPGQETELTLWLEDNNGRNNIYFVENLPLRGLRTSPTEAEIVGYLAVPLDIDLPVGICEEDREAVLVKLRSIDPPPTAIVWSGGGYQAHWLLEGVQPMGIAALVREQTLALARAMGGDHIQNPNRLMRLPGTRNVLNSKKRAAGRVPSDAYVVEAYWDRRYPVTTSLQTPSGPASPPETGAAQTLAGLDKTWRDRIVSGDTSFLRSRDKTRSAAVFAVACHLARRGWEAGTITALILDRSLGISAHIYDQRDPPGYAAKQAAAALEVVQNDFRRDERGNILGEDFENVRRGFERLRTQLMYDAFADRMLYVNGVTDGAALLDDIAVLGYRVKFEQELQFRPPKEYFFDACQVLARHHTISPVAAYLQEVQKSWDGTPRIETWLIRTAGADDTPYVRAISRLILLAAVSRAREPGCKFDEMVVFESPRQGTDKSTALATLAVNRDWFADSLQLGSGSKEVIEHLTGKWIVEFSELTGIRKNEVEAIKAFLSRQTDRARLAYGRFTTERPRNCVFFGTTNSTRYLKDEENRRFWPVRIKVFDIPALAAMRDQLWAEAAHEQEAGASIRLPRELWAEAARVQLERRVEDPWFEALDNAFGDIEGTVMTMDAWKVINKPEAYRNQEDNRRFGEAMRELGFFREKTTVRGFARSVWTYRRGTDPEKRRQLIYVHRDPVTQDVFVGHELPNRAPEPMSPGDQGLDFN
jgi:hypothetical protein